MKTNQKTTRMGIIGAGKISRSHIQAISGNPDIELVGIAEIFPEARERAAAEFGVPVFSDHQELLDAARPDYLTICTPHYSHGPITLAALEAGVHVFVEKPIAIEAAVAQQCIELAASRNLVLGVNYVRRLIPNYQRMAELVHGGFIGDLIHATMICAKRYRTMAYHRSGAWRATWAGGGGGVTVNQAPHDLDFLLWVLGVPERVVADLRPLCQAIEVEDNASAIMHFANGGNCTFHASNIVIPGRESFTVVGTKGTITLENKKLKAVFLDTDIRQALADVKPQPGEEQDLSVADSGERLAGMHENFCQAMHEGKPVVCSGAEALLEVQLANAMLISSIRKTWVDLPPDPRDFRLLLDKLIETKSMQATSDWARTNPAGTA